MTLIDQYNQGQFAIPPDGRYSVQICIAGQFKTILEKKIYKRKGTNYLPVFGLRYISIPHMEFNVLVDGADIIFKYQNGILIDRLRKIGHETWLGKLIYNGKFIDYFWLRRK